jgi:glycosyltransferase involved in cell wall biosynthesis
MSGVAVTVLLPVYNGEAYVGKVIGSVSNNLPIVKKNSSGVLFFAMSHNGRINGFPSRAFDFGI